MRYAGLHASAVRARRLLVREDDIGGLGWSRRGSSDRGDGAGAAYELRDDVGRDDAGATPAKVLENMRPMLMVGLATLAELVKK